MKKLGLITMFGTIILVVASALALGTQTAGQEAAKPEDTEVWQPEPKVVTPGATAEHLPLTQSSYSTARIWTSGCLRRTGLPRPNGSLPTAWSR